MCWLRRTLLLLLLTVPNFGLVFEKFSIPNFFRRSNSSIQNRLSDCLISILNDKQLPIEPVIRIYLEVQSESVNQEFYNTIAHFCSKSEEIASKLSNNGLCSRLGPQNNYWLFFIDSIKSLKYLRERVESKQTKNVSLSPRKEYYLIMIPKDKINRRKFLEEIFKYCWSKPILNVNVLNEDSSNGVITIYTYYPFTEGNCRNFLPIVQNRFINGTFEKNETIFLSKTSNFWKCPIRVIMWEDPLIIGEIQKSLHGTDYQYLKVLAYIVNASIEFVYAPEGKGEVYPNGSFDKAFKVLNDKVGDLMLGRWCTGDRQRVFEGVPYSFDKEVIIFKLPEAYSSLDILTFPFDTCTWIIVILVLIGKWISYLFLKQFFKDRRNAIKWIIGSWLLGIFILRIHYEGLIFKFLHNKPQRQLPNSLKEALEQKYKFIVPHTGLALYSQIQGTNDDLISDLKKDYIQTFNLIEDKKYAMIASEKYLSGYKNKIKNYYTAKKPMMKPLDCFYMSKYSFLTREFKNVLKLLDEHGFRKKISRSLMRRENDFKKVQPRPEKFTLQHLLGVFQMLLILVVVSCFIFCMEVFSRHNRFLCKFMEWFH